MEVIKKGCSTLINKYSGTCTVCSQETIALQNELTFSQTSGHAPFHKCINCGARVFYRLKPHGPTLLNENYSPAT